MTGYAFVALIQLGRFLKTSPEHPNGWPVPKIRVNRNVVVAQGSLTSTLPRVTGWWQSEIYLADLNRGDRDLAARVAARDQLVLEELFRQYAGAVKSVAYRVIRDETLAEDVVQDTFIGFWKSPEKYDPARGSLRTFLLTIAHRRAVDIVRSEEARTRRELRPTEPMFFDLEDEVMARRLSGDVRAALVGLTREEREAISLAYFAGLSYVQVANHLDTPEGTIKSRIRSGMRKLATSLEGVTP
jgi:RNA polymerase sigma-70 factor (ECF subfamily)